VADLPLAARRAEQGVATWEQLDEEGPVVEE